MRSDRKFYPTEFKSILKKGFKERGEFNLLQHESLLMTVWQDTKAVSALATNSQPLAITQVERKQQNGEKKLVNCPQLIANYNQKMGGVDRNDQLRQYYCLNTRGYKAYMYIFYFVTDVVITNTYLLQTFLSTSPFKTIKDFRLNLDHLLIGSYCGRKCPGCPSLCLPVKKFFQHHFPQKHDGSRHRCHYCYAFINKQRDTQCYCNDCSLYLCHTGKSDDCFLHYHTHHGPNEN